VCHETEPQLHIIRLCIATRSSLWNKGNRYNVQGMSGGMPSASAWLAASILTEYGGDKDEGREACGEERSEQQPGGLELRPS